MEKLLIVEDRPEICSQLRWGLGDLYEVHCAANRPDALSCLKKHAPMVVTLDLGLPPDEDGVSEGLRCLEEVLQKAPLTKVIMITGNREQAHALEAVQRGACDYYSKPFDLQKLKVMLERAFHLAALERENARRQHAVEKGSQTPGGIAGQSPGMQEVFSSIRKVAASDAAVLITGESGTGKELVARAIHGLSDRRSSAFVAINCGAIPENLIEAELFGYEKGAFSGAHTRVQGKVEFAHKGTLFLDEIGELPLNLQVKLLRFLQEKNLQRVGGREDIPVDTRILAATNRNIMQEAEEGSFRRDLYYRISVVNISLPPLRDRGSDIMMLAHLFLKRFAAQSRKKVRGFSPEAVKMLESYEWPGNVRELENKVQRAVIMSESPVIEPEALDFSLRSTAREKLLALSKLTLRDAREMIEREMIISAIENQKSNMARAAEALGISRPTLYDLTRKHGIEKRADSGAM